MTNGDTVGRVPNKPPMVKKTFYVAPKLWADAMARAAEREENLSDVIRDALRRYVRSK